MPNATSVSLISSNRKLTKRRDCPASRSLSIRITPKTQYELGKMPLERGQRKEAIEHLEAAASLIRRAEYIPLRLQAAYRGESRVADADREPKLHKNRAKSLERTVPQPVKRPWYSFAGNLLDRTQFEASGQVFFTFVALRESRLRSGRPPHTFASAARSQVHQMQRASDSSTRRHHRQDRHHLQAHLRPCEKIHRRVYERRRDHFRLRS